MASGLRQSYTLGSSVGSGSYADVWLAHRKNDASAAYAIKISSSQKGLQHARNEAAMMRRVAHPNALKLIEVGDTEDEVAVVTPYIDGGNLLDYLRNSNCLHEDHARSIFLQLVGVLHHAHLNYVVHRDIKLENILISKDGKTVYLADWGFAGEWKAGKLQTHPYGSLHYCAPEIVRGAPYFGPEVDIWSLGVVLYALNSAKLPFRGETPRKIHKRILVAEPSYPAHFSPSLIALVSAMLNPDRSLRATIPEILESAWVVEGGVTPELLAATTLAVSKTEPAAHCIDTAEALALARQEQARLEEAALRRNGGARSPFPAQLS